MWSVNTIVRWIIFVACSCVALLLAPFYATHPQEFVNVSPDGLRKLEGFCLACFGFFILGASLLRGRRETPVAENNAVNSRSTPQVDREKRFLNAFRKRPGFAFALVAYVLALPLLLSLVPSHSAPKSRSEYWRSVAVAEFLICVGFAFVWNRIRRASKRSENGSSPP
jgi:hypothetical protein